MDNEIDFLPFKKRDLDEAFSIYRKELYVPIDDTFGWNEEFQQKRFQEQYQLEWFKWIISKSCRIGFVCVSPKNQEIHVSLLMLLKEFQGQGLGEKTMKRILNGALSAT